jgi:hypothetical protein
MRRRDHELFVVIYGRASVAVEDGAVLELGPGVARIFRAGERTVWTVHETLRKIYQTTG